MNFQTNNGQKSALIGSAKKLRDTGTLNRLTGSGRPRSARTEENVDRLTIWF